MLEVVLLAVDLGPGYFGVLPVWNASIPGLTLWQTSRDTTKCAAIDIVLSILSPRYGFNIDLADRDINGERTRRRFTHAESADAMPGHESFGVCH